MGLAPRPSSPGTGAPRPFGEASFVPVVLETPRAANRQNQRGAGHLKAIVWTLVLVAVIYGAVIVLPVLISEYEFQDSLQEIARFASVNRKTTEQIKQSVLEEAQKQDLPVQLEDIKVEGYSGNVHIDVDYSVTVDLKVYQWTFNFHPTASNAALL
jgi:hypothetical protein